ncbi:MAG: putative Ig domain-containing protein [Coriobacteriales bacterium]|jgi:hypothetical protein|nr:putative Ig domain-containing protein [Coriobacteriales bacterium]
MTLVLVVTMLTLVTPPKAAFATETKTFVEWFNPDGATSDSYINKIAALFGKTATDSISDDDLATYTGGLALTGADIPAGTATNLDKLAGLTSLSITQATNFTDASFTSKMPNLSYLDLSGDAADPDTGFSDLSTITGPNLEALILAGDNCSDLTQLKPMPKLAILDLSGNSITDPALPATLPSLTYLNLHDNVIFSLTTLPILPAIKEIDLSGQRHAGGYDLGQLTKYAPTLTALDLTVTGQTDFSGIEVFNNLVFLGLRANMIVDPSALSVLTGLQELDLALNKIEDPALIAALRSALPNTALLFEYNPAWPYSDLFITNVATLPTGKVAQPYSLGLDISAEAPLSPNSLSSTFSPDSTFSLNTASLTTLATQTLTLLSVDYPLTWSVVDGSLPAGLSLDAQTGAISGTPTAPGSFRFAVQAIGTPDTATPDNQAAGAKYLALTINATDSPSIPATGDDGLLWLAALLLAAAAVLVLALRSAVLSRHC